MNTIASNTCLVYPLIIMVRFFCYINREEPTEDNSNWNPVHVKWKAEAQTFVGMLKCELQVRFLQASSEQWFPNFFPLQKLRRVHNQQLLSSINNNSGNNW